LMGPNRGQFSNIMHQERIFSFRTEVARFNLEALLPNPVSETICGCLYREWTTLYRQAVNLRAGS
jgi:hypothetical protein